MHLQKALGECAAQPMQALANGMEKYLVAVAAFNASCLQRYRINIAPADRRQTFPVPKPAQMSLRRQPSAEAAIDQRNCRKLGSLILLEA